ncbi:ORF6N domain-containing protein [Elusimicrobiota bacterium]
MKTLSKTELIESKIYLIRGYRVMLDSHLAELYGAEAKQLKRRVRRNAGRFPPDFMFELSRQEYESLRCHFGTLKTGAHSKYLPYVFTEQGVAMLSNVLHGKRAINVNIAIMRTFVKIRQILLERKDWARQMQELERRIEKNEMDIKTVFQVIKQIMEPIGKTKPRIDFFTDRGK